MWWHLGYFANEVGLSRCNGIKDVVNAELVSDVGVPDVLVLHVFLVDTNDLSKRRVMESREPCAGLLG